MKLGGATMPTLQTERPRVESHSSGIGPDFVRILFAILLPPIGVLLQVGLTKHFFLNVLLTVLGYLPGIIHAVWVILKFR
jgi:uncharacterized membrane protein YqaE (UPF0057 family)